ncbi:secretion protein HlyD [Microcoleus vaginatus]|uniref:secretion protein HlyD n=1 Tax=Microcoleus vaginatus TaxID=119532 RepID=UPI00168412B4|nr:secretion protein HlyD [Microcoleus sp. FACHB-84]MBD2009471.1 secretion protein HlyD [Microcoleus sp. FACHB-45]
MSENQEGSLFIEVTDRESATVNGGSITSGVIGAKSNSETHNSSSDGLTMLFFLPPPSQLYQYNPNDYRPYPTLVV